MGPKVAVKGWRKIRPSIAIQGPHPCVLACRTREHAPLLCPTSELFAIARDALHFGRHSPLSSATTVFNRPCVDLRPSHFLNRSTPLKVPTCVTHPSDCRSRHSPITGPWLAALSAESCPTVVPRAPSGASVQWHHNRGRAGATVRPRARLPTPRPPVPERGHSGPAVHLYSLRGGTHHRLGYHQPCRERSRP
jgi:hypothetical protein